MRWKLMAGNVLAVLVVGLVAWLIVRGQVADSLSRDVDPSVERGVGLFATIRTAEGDRFTSVVADGAQESSAQAIFALTQESQQREAAFTFAQQFSQQLGRGYSTQAAHLVAVTDATGHVLARNVQADADSGRDLRTEYEVVATALTTNRVARDYLKYDQQRWYDVAVAPVNVDGQLRGLLLVGYEIADSIAQQDATRLGADAAYIINDENRWTLRSLSINNPAVNNALVQWANNPTTNLAAVFNSDNQIPVREIQLGADTYRLSARGMPGLIRHTRAGESRPGFVVLRNVTAARAPATPNTLPILWLALVGLVMVVAYNLAVGNYLERPIEQIEEGLLRIINGDRDHRIEIQHAELGGIVYRVNQLVSELTGAEEETDETGRISRPPPRPSADAPPAAQDGPLIDESSIASFNPTGNPADGQLAAQLAAESENDYYDRLRREYMAARQRAGLGSDRMTHEQFVESVRASEQGLAQKHQATLVRFQVQTQGNQVIFRAIPIR